MNNMNNLTDYQKSLLAYKSFSQHRIYSVYYQYEQIMSYYALFLIIAGTIFNY